MSLARTRDQIREHSSNQWARELGYEPVYTASPTAKIMIVGQAPGRTAQETLTPWNDPSGDNLRAWLGLTREEFYNEEDVALVPMDFYYPGKGRHGDLPPRPDFAPCWHPRILADMPAVEVIILAGRYAQQYYLGSTAERTLTETVRNYQKYLPRFFPVVHPSPLNIRWRKNHPWFEAEVVPAVRRRVYEVLQKPPSA